LLTVLDDGAWLVELSGFVAILRLLATDASELFCTDNLVPVGFNIGVFVDFCCTKFHVHRRANVFYTSEKELQTNGQRILTKGWLLTTE